MEEVKKIYRSWFESFDQAVRYMKPLSLPGAGWLMENFLSRFDMESYAFDVAGYRDRMEDYVNDILLPHKVAVFSQGIELYGRLASRQPALKLWLSLDDFALQLYAHDLSKYSSEELMGYAIYDFSLPGYNIELTRGGKVKEPMMNSEGATRSLAKAWEHHQRVNAHHPEYYYCPDSTREMPTKFILEMLADWKGAGMTYGTPLEHWIKTDFGISKFRFNRKSATYVDHYLSLMDIDTGKLKINVA